MDDAHTMHIIAGNDLARAITSESGLTQTDSTCLTRAGKSHACRCHDEVSNSAIACRSDGRLPWFPPPPDGQATMLLDVSAVRGWRTPPKARETLAGSLPKTLRPARAKTTALALPCPGLSDGFMLQVTVLLREAHSRRQQQVCEIFQRRKRFPGDNHLHEDGPVRGRANSGSRCDGIAHWQFPPWHEHLKSFLPTRDFQFAEIEAKLLQDGIGPVPAPDDRQRARFPDFKLTYDHATNATLRA